jgi:hypothetical protein
MTTPATIFSVVNLLPLPIWFIWIAAPRSAAARWLAQTLWPWQLLATIYLATLLIALSDQPSGGGFGSLAAVMRLFDSEWGTLAGWVHYLCFDLFVARWIVNDAPNGGYRLAPVLFLTLMFGPIGLLVYTLGRTVFQGSLPGRTNTAISND